MLINTNKTSWNVTLSDGQPLRTLALVSRGCIYPRPTLLSHHDQNLPLFTNTVFLNKDLSSLDNHSSLGWATGLKYRQIMDSWAQYPYNNHMTPFSINTMTKLD